MIEILIGTIASGKSTYCKTRAKEGAIIINDDAIVEAIHAGNYKLYSKDLKPLYKAVETQIFLSAILLGRDVIIDRGLSLTRSSRLRWIGLAKSFDQTIIARIFKFDLPYEHAKRRFNSDSRGLPFIYWWNVALQHTSIYEKPTLEEGFDLIMKDKPVTEAFEWLVSRNCFNFELAKKLGEKLGIQIDKTLKV